MKNPGIILSLMVLLLWPAIAKTQSHTTESVVVVHPSRFRVGDMYYASSVRGLKYFMKDLENDNPDLHRILSPEFNSIKKSRDAANILWVASGVAGTTLAVGAFTFWQMDQTIFKPGDPHYDPNAKEPNPALIAGALGVYVLGGWIGYLIFPKDDDIYNFINLHNRNSPDRKMDWGIGLHLFPGMEPGVRLALKF